ncbi:MFS transporter [Xanthomonas hortorum]|uniref:MFS transporter n=1 Tax=Xanthomonas hortorum TaxID=56454 RepID=UPI0015D5FFD1|nr:MFS transporter [Xanthomonas hortorum]MCE4360296.1 MFS transporter [Xanthomonas hortorum pv. taraxaci]NMI54004.1 MFS transporter [Xanthomonas hortorum pv. taraxaci]CAD0302207.1 Purine ribonucleoside efflux pump NepI [Xanthomonas hortorum pv. taraxaci]CAD0302215.1 Purine ribonucleoside efflux pump NepI [Xanthomonas hortorum pv. taraxaci]
MPASSLATDTSSRAAPAATRQTWSAVGSMSLCVALLIASEFMPVSLLTPIAADLHASAGMAGQAISISGLFAVVASLLIAPLSSRFNRRHVLLTLTTMMLVSLLLIANAHSFGMLMVARALLGVVIGGFWALSTATVMRIMPEPAVPKALGIIFIGNAVAAAVVAPLGSYLGATIGWRGVFWGMLPLVALTIVWQWRSLPSMPAQGATSLSGIVTLLKRRYVARAMLAVMLGFAGAFSAFTYFRPFLETIAQVDVSQLSLLLLGLGLSGFAGTYAATTLVPKRLFTLLTVLPVALGVATMCMLLAGHVVWAVAMAMIAWGTLNAAMPVAWSTWLSRCVKDAPESGGGLMVAAIQLSIMLGGAAGGVLLDHVSIGATFVGASVLLLASSLVAGRGDRLQP